MTKSTSTTKIESPSSDWLEARDIIEKAPPPPRIVMKLATARISKLHNKDNWVLSGLPLPNSRTMNASPLSGKQKIPR